MRTHIELDDATLEQVLRLGRFPSKKAAVNAALNEYARLLKRRQLAQLRGRIPWQADLDQLRASRPAADQAPATAATPADHPDPKG